MSREEILGAIRRGLRRGALPDDQAMGLRARLAAHPRHLIPARSRVPRPEQVALFIRNLEKEFATFLRVPGAADVPAAVAEYLAAQNLPSEFAMAPHPELQEIPWHERPLLQRREGRAAPTDLVSVQQGYLGIAETGTLMLPAAPERPTTLWCCGSAASSAPMRRPGICCARNARTSAAAGSCRAM
jgi:L-lactate dehydrogenase complex protein LldG